MKLLNNLISWLYILGTVALGLVLILSVSGFEFKENIELFINEQLNSPSGIWSGIIFVLLGLLFMSLRIKAEKGNKTISFDNPEGEVTITIKAIEDFVKRVGQEFSQVTEMIPTIVSMHNGIKITAKTTLIAGANLPRISESIQRTIKSRMQSILGIENILGVEIYISKLVAKGGALEEPTQQTLDVG